MLNPRYGPLDTALEINGLDGLYETQVGGPVYSSCRSPSERLITHLEHTVIVSLLVFGAAAPSGTWPPHSRRF